MSYRLQSPAGASGSSLIKGSRRIGATLKTLIGGVGISISEGANSLTLNAGAAADPDLDLGASGTAGTLDIFPTTASKGKLELAAADSAGDTTTLVTNASQSGARTYTIPDAGASASFVMTEGTQTVNGTKTIPALNTTNLDAGASGTAGTVDIFPTTASKGKVTFSCTDQTGNTTVAVTIGAMAAARTITLADPGGTANLLTDVGIGGQVTARTSAAVTKNANTTYANVTGLSATVQVGTYRYRAVLPSTVASGTGGIKYCFNYTTTVLTSIESTAKGFTASAVAVQHTTTTTTQTDLFTQAAVVILTELEGTMVVSTGGTIDIQMAQNTSNASDTVALVGGSFVMSRIA